MKYDPDNPTGRYVLGGADGRTPVPEPDLLRWAQWLESHDRHVALTEMPNGHGFVSTVFLGLDHGFGHTRRPVLYETLSALGGEWGDFGGRWCTWAEAEAGHARIVAEVLAVIEQATGKAAALMAGPNTVEGGGGA